MLNVFFISVLVLGLFFHKVQAEEVVPLQIIQNIFQETKSRTFQKDMMRQGKVTAFFDYHQMTKNILGNEYQKHPKSELVWFENMIRDIVSKTVYPKSYDFLSNVTLKHEILKANKKAATLLTLVKKRGEETEVQSQFAHIDTEWKIVDIAIDDESWVGNIRDQVHKTIKEKKWEGLKKSLTQRLNDLKKEKK